MYTQKGRRKGTELIFTFHFSSLVVCARIGNIMCTRPDVVVGVFDQILLEDWGDILQKFIILPIGDQHS